MLRVQRRDYHTRAQRREYAGDVLPTHRHTACIHGCTIHGAPSATGADATAGACRGDAGRPAAPRRSSTRHCHCDTAIAGQLDAGVSFASARSERESTATNRWTRAVRTAICALGRAG